MINRKKPETLPELSRGFIIIQILCWSLVAATPGRANESWAWFNREVGPILKEHCAECHSGEKRKGGFSMNTRETILSGSETEDVVVVGKPSESFLIELVRESDPDFRMPPEDKNPLNENEIAVLEKWIAEGMVWPDGLTLGRVSRRAPLQHREVSLPDNSDLVNPIDRILSKYLSDNNLELNPPAAPNRWLRKAWLDTIGLLPEPSDVLDFDGIGYESREGVADALLERNEDYAAHWLTRWNDWLRNDYRGTGFIDGGRKQITEWLFNALYTNKPYDRFVSELLTEAPGAEGFLHGIKWRGTVNDSQRREMQAAQSISQIFLGTNLKCASCHDSFVNDWKLREAYAFASVFSDEPLELHRCDKPIGKTIEPAFLFPELGTINAAAPRAEKLKRLSDLMTSPDNGRLARTIVNRLWNEYFGHGIVADVDDMDQLPFSEDLLDWLALDLVEHDYNLKRTLRLILTSDAYLASSSDAPDRDRETFQFTGPVPRRMDAEIFVDAVSTLTREALEPGPAAMKKDGRGQGGQLAAIGKSLASGKKSALPATAPDARWIWGIADAHKSAPAGNKFRAGTTFEVVEGFSKALLTATADNSIVVFINGKKSGETREWNQPVVADVTDKIREGENEIRFEAANGGDSPNPAGALVALELVSAEGEIVRTIGSNAAWKAADGSAVHELGNSNIGPWNMGDKLRGGPEFEMPERIRAAYLYSDELTRAMGRPSREQIVTRRDAYATTLELLELTNGQTLDDLLKKGANQWMEDFKASPHQAVNRIFMTALSRPATAGEMQSAFELVGVAPTSTGIQDLLWIVSMLPEFQIID